MRTLAWKVRTTAWTIALTADSRAEMSSQEVGGTEGAVVVSRMRGAEVVGLEVPVKGVKERCEQRRLR